MPDPQACAQSIWCFAMCHALVQVERRSGAPHQLHGPVRGGAAHRNLGALLRSSQAKTARQITWTVCRACISCPLKVFCRTGGKEHSAGGSGSAERDG